MRVCGGWMNEALEYVEYNHGIDTEESYPYTAQDGTCMFNKTKRTTVSNVINITKGNSSELLIALENGVLPVAIDAEKTFKCTKVVFTQA